MNEIAQSNQLITRLTENGRRNATTFGAAGIQGPGRQTRCPRCGLFEGLLFWNLVACESGCLELRCPAGCGTLINFRIDAAGEVRGVGSRSRSDASADDSVGAVGGGWFTLSLVFVAVAGLAFSHAHRGEITDRLRSSITETGSTSGRAWTSPGSSPRSFFAGLARRSTSSDESITLPFSSLWHSPAVRVLTGEGDRSEEITAHIDNVAEAYGEDIRSAVQSVQYAPEANATRVVVYSDLPAWKAYFSSSLPDILAARSAEAQ